MNEEILGFKTLIAAERPDINYLLFKYRIFQRFYVAFAGVTALVATITLSYALYTGEWFDTKMVKIGSITTLIFVIITSALDLITSITRSKSKRIFFKTEIEGINPEDKQKIFDSY